VLSLDAYVSPGVDRTTISACSFLNRSPFVPARIAIVTAPPHPCAWHPATFITPHLDAFADLIAALTQDRPGSL
jgi:hypothetical protein